MGTEAVMEVKDRDPTEDYTNMSRGSHIISNIDIGKQNITHQEAVQEESVDSVTHNRQYTSQHDWENLTGWHYMGHGEWSPPEEYKDIEETAHSHSIDRDPESTSGDVR